MILQFEGASLFKSSFQIRIPKFGFCSAFHAASSQIGSKLNLMATKARFQKCFGLSVSLLSLPKLRFGSFEETSLAAIFEYFSGKFEY